MTAHARTSAATSLKSKASAPVRSNHVSGTAAGPLRISGPPGRREQVVVDAVDAIAAQRVGDVTKAVKAIADHGLSIEVTRLRERLPGVVATDLQRLLLSTPGVTERLFLDAIEEQLAEEEERERRAATAVQDSSVDEVADVVKSSIDHLADTLGAAIAKALGEVMGHDVTGQPQPGGTAAAARTAGKSTTIGKSPQTHGSTS